MFIRCSVPPLNPKFGRPVLQTPCLLTVAGRLSLHASGASETVSTSAVPFDGTIIVSIVCVIGFDRPKTAHPLDCGIRTLFRVDTFNSHCVGNIVTILKSTVMSCGRHSCKLRRVGSVYRSRSSLLFFPELSMEPGSWIGREGLEINGSWTWLAWAK